MSPLIRSLRRCHLRLLSGQSFAQASHDLSFPIADLQNRKIAQNIFQKILAFQAPAGPSLKLLIEIFSFEENAKHTLLEKTYMPNLQLKVLSFVSACLMVAIFWIQPTELQSLPIFAFSILLVSLGFILSRYFQKQFHKIFWVPRWIQYLSLCSAQIQTGQTFCTALYSLAILEENLPKILADRLAILQSALQGKNLQDSEVLLLKSRVKDNSPQTEEIFFQAQEQIEVLYHLSQNGESLLTFLKNSVDDLSQDFQLTVQKSGDKAQLKMLLPLFAFILPAFWLTLLGPVLISLLRVSE